MNVTTIGFAVCGSFCTFGKAIAAMRSLVESGYKVLPIMSENAYKTDTRFGKASDIVGQIEEICKEKVIHTIEGAEPIGPKKMCDLIVVAPCTGNTLAKMCLGVTDTAVCIKHQYRTINANKAFVVRYLHFLAYLLQHLILL